MEECQSGLMGSLGKRVCLTAPQVRILSLPHLIIYIMKKDYMNFGKLREAYNSGRFGYPKEVINYVFSFINTNSKVLDLGCGTGIATRQLKLKIKNICGSDIDKKMIEVAKKNDDKINYYINSCRKMFFKNKEFDTITSFGAFHWFYDSKSVVETKRILKNKGIFIVINKNEVGDFKNNFRKTIEKITNKKLPERVKIGYNPGQILAENNFSNIMKKKFLVVEEFTISRALNQLQSMGS